MLRIVILCDAPSGKAIGVKEDLAMYLEKWGDCRVTDVQEISPYQLKINEAVEIDPVTGEWREKR